MAKVDRRVRVRAFVVHGHDAAVHRVLPQVPGSAGRGQDGRDEEGHDQHEYDPPIESRPATLEHDEHRQHDYGDDGERQGRRPMHERRQGQAQPGGGHSRRRQ